MKPLIVTGMSGAGKHTAIQVLEDFGYNCVDNLPVPLLKNFVDLNFSGKIGEEESRYAVVIDIRNGKNLSILQSILDELDADGKGFEILFLDAQNYLLYLHELIHLLLIVNQLLQPTNFCLFY